MRRCWLNLEINEWDIRIEGLVQGVGFRASVQGLARLHHIKGYVRNCIDGSVEICAQANANDLEAFLQAVRQQPGRGSIDQVTIAQRRPNELFSAFSVR